MVKNSYTLTKPSEPLEDVIRIIHTIITTFEAAEGINHHKSQQKYDNEPDHALNSIELPRNLNKPWRALDRLEKDLYQI